MSDSLKYSAYSGALWGATVYALAFITGSEVSLGDAMTDSALMAASVYASDQAHAMLGMKISSVSSAAGSAAFFAGAQALWRGDENYLTNALAAAANDMAVGMIAPVQ